MFTVCRDLMNSTKNLQQNITAGDCGRCEPVSCSKYGASCESLNDSRLRTILAKENSQ